MKWNSNMLSYEELNCVSNFSTAYDTIITQHSSVWEMFYSLSVNEATLAGTVAISQTSRMNDFLRRHWNSLVFRRFQVPVVRDKVTKWMQRLFVGVTLTEVICFKVDLVQWQLKWLHAIGANESNSTCTLHTTKPSVFIFHKDTAVSTKRKN